MSIFPQTIKGGTLQQLSKASEMIASVGHTYLKPFVMCGLYNPLRHATKLIELVGQFTERKEVVVALGIADVGSPLIGSCHPTK